METPDVPIKYLHMYICSIHSVSYADRPYVLTKSLDIYNGFFYGFLCGDA